MQYADRSEYKQRIPTFSIHVDIISSFITSCLLFLQRIKTDADEASKPRSRFSVVHTPINCDCLSCCITFERHWDRKVGIRTQLNSCMVSHIIQHCWHVETVMIIKRLSLRLAVYFPQIYRSLYSLLLGTRPLAILLALHRPSPIRLLLLACVWYYLSAQGNQCQARSDVGN